MSGRAVTPEAMAAVLIAANEACHAGRAVIALLDAGYGEDAVIEWLSEAMDIACRSRQEVAPCV